MVAIVLASGLIWLTYQSGLLQIWTATEEYSHGLIAVAVVGYVLYRRRVAYGGFQPGNVGFSAIPAVMALTTTLVGAASGIAVLGHYAIWLFAVSAVMALGGFGLLRRMLVPLLIILLLLPLPNPLGPMLTAELQLVSSSLGVWFIRLVGGSVYLEGNVLDMGGSKLLVAEACAGLRYLFPLMSLGAVAGFVLHAAFWVRWTVFLVTIPITVLMNSLRIALTGILVEGGGGAHTEGFLHFFEGWVVFVLATALLMVVAWSLVRLQPGGGTLTAALALDVPAPLPPAGLQATSEQPPARVNHGRALLPVAASVLLAAVASGLLAGRDENAPVRRPLGAFPGQVGEWSSHPHRLPAVIEDVAGASEYYYADFIAPSGEEVNVYVSYYEDQRHGRIPHSPKVCIPSGGWTIDSLEPVRVRPRSGAAFEANRLVTSLSGQRVVTYYWLKQGARMYRQELLARLDLIRFSLLENRTDGALIRLVAKLRPGEGLVAADARLQRFSGEFVHLLPAYVPD